ncbi:hypothetical protein PPYR_10133 [Photinus pyralis]|uniref:Uncharacterized protein n=1 Tax=Photinus pyralis TaxID=7054 RepID=A0A5N4AFF6_PHOPY|nr:uncharacterized protein LOC116175046 [Photinus pyralis]KAB0796072.1 hypothetical protein PPYR_10133 [Photinus pyralis]
MANKCRYERRRTLAERLNNWRARNDSTNVSLLLSGDHLSEPKKTEKRSPCQTCYCRKSPVLSKFNLRPISVSEGYSHSSPAELSQRTSSGPRPAAVALRTVEEARSELISPRRRTVRSNSPEPARLQNLETFRKDNYFECHSSANIHDVPVGDHKCVHKFVLNNRLIPEPLNADPFGTSRCVRCNKPMRIKAEEERSKPLTQRARPRITPNAINIAGETNVTEIQIPANFNKLLELFQETATNISKVKPTNTLALRHQKGVVLN